MSTSSPVPHFGAHSLSRRALLSSAVGGTLAALSACSNPLGFTSPDSSGDGGLGVLAPKHQPIFVTASRKHTDSSGLDSDVTYELDDHGNMISASGTRSDHKRDENGKSTQEVEEYSFTTTFAVDENGWTTDWETTGDTDEHSGKGHYDLEFNDDGTLARRVATNPDDGTEVSTVEYEYDADGNLTKETTTSSSKDGSSTYVSTMLFNTDGFVTETDDEGDGFTSTSTYEYETDDDGVVTAANISNDYGQGDPLRSRLEFEYDDDGNISKVTTKMESFTGTSSGGKTSYHATGDSEYTYQWITDPSDAAVLGASTRPIR